MRACNELAGVNRFENLKGRENQQRGIRKFEIVFRVFCIDCLQASYYFVVFCFFFSPLKCKETFGGKCLDFNLILCSAHYFS